MTPEEFGQTLEAMNPTEHLAFLRKFAERRDKNPNSGFVEYLVEHPEDEPWLAHLVGLPTEAEKNTGAATSSARSARVSAILAGISALVAIAALAVTLWQSCSKQANAAQQSAGGDSNTPIVSTPPNTSLEPTATALANSTTR